MYSSNAPIQLDPGPACPDFDLATVYGLGTKQHAVQTASGASRKSTRSFRALHAHRPVEAPAISLACSGPARQGARLQAPCLTHSGRLQEGSARARVWRGCGASKEVCSHIVKGPALLELEVDIPMELFHELCK